ncbi:GPI-anchored protein 52 [Phytophthora citrophthora]|uniref:glucan endo-1,3-beta-D-glucosidase n=1 Tax=Phytophthora citrophthora TaxID=4793 RepID=A0AAD9LHQ0_9STRA|nr:GPI-anchored protein 52 [Phytophthora citrophthora]
MVKVAMPAKVAIATCLYAAVASAETVNFINKCSYPIELYHSQSGSAAAKVADIATGATHTEDVSGPAHMYRHSADNSATLVEMACDGHLWYDLSIIPPLPGWCTSYEDCKAGGTKTGFNVPISVTPKTNVGKGTCAALQCAADDKNACSDAYQFPKDDTKTHNCPVGTELDVTFCYADGGDATQQDQNQSQDQNQNQDQYQQNSPAATTATPATTAPVTEERGATQQGSSQGTVQSYADLGKVKAKYEYKGKNAGNVPGSYNRVTDLATCSKESVSVQSPVGPMAEPVSMIFRGPCEIENIAVYSDEGGNGTWHRVSSYSRQAGTVENLTFMNNKNIDYTGRGQHGPQGYASADGNSKADEPTVFAGELCEASDPSKIGGGPGISTGAEINIMTGEKCNGDCLGFHGDNDYKGWNGGKKAFVTEVKMPLGKTPNQPAIWMLNAQVMHSNQYGCNCRGMGPVGGCGELDIAEVIETNPSRDMVTTHYYFYDGTVLSPGGDNFAPRSFDSTTVYVTLIDDSNEGLIKIVELESFDFTQTELGSLYQQLVDC